MGEPSLGYDPCSMPVFVDVIREVLERHHEMLLRAVENDGMSVFVGWVMQKSMESLRELERADIKKKKCAEQAGVDIQKDQCAEQFDDVGMVVPEKLKAQADVILSVRKWLDGEAPDSSENELLAHYAREV